MAHKPARCRETGRQRGTGCVKYPAMLVPRSPGGGPAVCRGVSSPGYLTPLFRDINEREGMPWALSVLRWTQHRLPLSGAGAGYPRAAWGVTYTCPGIGLLA